MSDRTGTANSLWTAADAVRATNGVTAGAWQASGVSIDTRSLAPGDLFVALAGPNHDAHDYVPSALNAGAAAAMVRAGARNLPETSKLLKVLDTEEGLRSLARFARSRSNARICAVTGSVGKTGTKELLAAALGSAGSVTATAGNLNNHFGLPLSLARMPANADFGVFEMGMNHANEITPLSEIARPHVAIITSIAPVHIEFFDSIDGIAAAKAEIFDGLVEGGDAVINADQDHFEFLAARARARGAGRVLSFGESEAADGKLLSCRIDADGTHVEADILGNRLSYKLQLRGRHWAMNSLAVLLAADACGVDLPQAAESLNAVEPPKGRGRALKISTGSGPATVIDETYNASPVAVRAAIDLLAQTAPGDGGRRIAVLGDMLELGGRSAEEHAGLAPALINAGIDQVFVCGQYMSDIMNALPGEMRGGSACSSAKLAPMVAEAVHAGDLVMIKGSAGARMGAVVDALSGNGGRA